MLASPFRNTQWWERFHIMNLSLNKCEPQKAVEIVHFTQVPPAYSTGNKNNNNNNKTGKLQ